ncbi:MAG TPA: agmatine deiminase family protein, partial [Xanthomonadaceae bacterium]|nr:agmatine deiminase family protein [Xanthomonadaceae bacterium]
MIAPAFRFPAEWEPQSAVLVAWPHAGTDWAARLPAIESCYVGLIGAIALFQPVLVCVASTELRVHASRLLEAADIPAHRLRYVQVEYDDTWLRDSGPISLIAHNGFRLLDFRFNAWGDKYASSRDDRLVENLFAQGLFHRARRDRSEFALEGGAIETDGDGTLLCTWHCLHSRHPGLDRSELSTRLAETLHQRRVLWLDHGVLDGDDTDAHIDTLARFAAPDAIVHQSCDDTNDAHYDELRRMEDDLAAMHTLDGKSYRLFALPWPQPIMDEGRRLAASYANFLIVNGGVLMPA